jgi:hypothetical protein
MRHFGRIPVRSCCGRRAGAPATCKRVSPPPCEQRCRAPLPGSRNRRGRDSFPPAFPRDLDSICDAGLRRLRRRLENRCGPYGPPRVRIPPPPFFGLVEPSSPRTRALDARRDVSSPEQWCQRTSAHLDDRLRHRDSIPPACPGREHGIDGRASALQVPPRPEQARAAAAYYDDPCRSLAPARSNVFRLRPGARPAIEGRARG